MKTIQITVISLVIGAAFGFGVSHFFASNGHDMSEMDLGTFTEKDDEILYWVAPMDPNYKRDEPGKSPMGMDLIPIYAGDANNSNDKAGTVKISSAVENNLGVKTTLVKRDNLSRQIETVGYIGFDESKLWQTNSRVSGWIEKLNVNAVGEKVKKHAVLFTLYSPELVKTQEELLNAYRTGRKGLINGATERLLSMGVDRLQIQQIVKQGKPSRTIEVKAHDDGIIANLNIREGGYLSPAQTVISAGSLDNVWVDAEVFERQAHWIKKGDKAVMSLDAIPGESWQGKVDYIYPILDPKTRTLRVRLKFANPKGELKPNMFAKITLQHRSSEKVLTVPKSSVIRSGSMARVVLAEGDGKYRSARIEVGRETKDNIEVLQGLKESDRIVTSAHFMLDSESSQSADLSRINGADEKAQAEWAKGVVTDVMVDHKMLTINHEPVPAWQWPAMVMNFSLAKSINVDQFSVGQAIDFEMRKSNSGQYEIIDYKINKNQLPDQVWVQGEITTLLPDFGMVTLEHQAIKEWKWQAGEMNFEVDDAVNLAEFKEGEKVLFQVAKKGVNYQLKALKRLGDDK